MVVLTSKSIIKHHLYDADFGDAHISRTSGISSNLRVIDKGDKQRISYVVFGIWDRGFKRINTRLRFIRGLCRTDERYDGNNRK